MNQRRVELAAIRIQTELAMWTMFAQVASSARVAQQAKCAQIPQAVMQIAVRPQMHQRRVENAKIQTQTQKVQLNMFAQVDTLPVIQHSQMVTAQVWQLATGIAAKRQL
jgi:hypothetical protein